MKIIESKIIDVKLIEKNQIIDDRGKIKNMLRNDDKNFTKFGEIYFSFVNPNKIKAWHLHKQMTLNYVAVSGSIKLVLYDDRKNSKTNGILEEINLSDDKHLLVSIPPMIWNGFCSNNSEPAILANCSDIPHDKEEIIRIPYNDKRIPYEWKF
jgi:dTDP-4-dehydrorhamnose 3,5-epimerase|tara:strand:+ start:271 stop:729 length:459 start_codon:yes stop_codon:yes gene_type:complete